METDSASIHVLRRLSLGISPGDVAQLQDTGIDDYIKEQLTPSSLSDPPSLTAALSELRTLGMSPIERFEYLVEPLDAAPNTDASRQEKRQRLRQLVREAMHARLLRAIYSPRTLHEVMVNFWFNHFNIFSARENIRAWLGDYDHSVIRPHALGQFRDLLHATAKHPAMLVYLDNWRNAAPGRPGSTGQFSGLNENYARELLELHTLGVDGGYTEADVVALSRIFTGWTMVQRRKHSPDETGFRFADNRHDLDNKHFLGRTIVANGKAEGEQVLDLLANHPATAQYISYKLAQYFVADQPPGSLVNRLAQRFTATQGHIASVLQTLFESDAFWQSAGQKFRTPYEYILAVMRAISPATLTADELAPIAYQMEGLGMGLFRCPSPDGYGNTQDRWLSPDAMLRRVSVAITLYNRQPEPRPSMATLLDSLGPSISPATRQTLRTSPARLQAAMVLGSPDMMYR